MTNKGMTTALINSPDTIAKIVERNNLHLTIFCSISIF